MVQEQIAVNDGADEQMLGTDDNEKLAGKREEVKFIKEGDHQNGDAKIDIGLGKIGKDFTGMTKEELMKYANDPFWVRLRWIFFVAFWAIWAGMLIGAILIIINAPKCAAPEPLPWYKRGPLAKFKSSEVGPQDVKKVNTVKAAGVIYELPAALTYSVHEIEVEQKIKNIVDQYRDQDVNVILDLTPNYVTKDAAMVKEALEDDTKRSAFVWIQSPQVPNNWLSIVNGSAWSEVQSGSFVLSQFGDGLYDLNMNDTIVKKKLSDTLRHLIGLGVKGFRLKNTKFFLLSKSIQDEVPAPGDASYIHDQYGFWTHTQTTFQDGLGDLLYEYLTVVKNESADAFLSVAEDVVRPEAYRTKDGSFGVDMPIYGRFVHVLSDLQGKNIQHELMSTMNTVGNNTWLQWDFTNVVTSSSVDPTAIDLFVSLLPGVPILPMDDPSTFELEDGDENKVFKHIQQLRMSPSYMHGEFDMYNSEGLVSYSRIKSGNPGYFVIYNPTGMTQTGNFSDANLPDKMTVIVVSDNYNVTNIAPKLSVMTQSIGVSPYASIILTYVPVKSG